MTVNQSYTHRLSAKAVITHKISLSSTALIEFVEAVKAGQVSAVISVECPKGDTITFTWDEEKPVD